MDERRLHLVSLCGENIVITKDVAVMNKEQMIIKRRRFAGVHLTGLTGTSLGRTKCPMTTINDISVVL